MAVEHRQKTVVYKEAVIVGLDAPADPLAELVKRAFAERRRASERRQVDTGGGNRLINTTRTLATMVAGTLLEFTAGNHQMVVNLDDEAEEYSLKQLAPPGKLDEFLESQLYFGVIEDHVAVVQSKSLRAGHLEAYLNWLLKERTAVLPGSARLILRDHITLPKGASPKKVQKVKKVTLRTHVTPATFASGGEGADGVLVPESRGGAPPGPAVLLRRAVEGLIPAGMQSLVDSLATAQGLAVEDLEVSLEIRRRGRQKTDAPRSLLDEMAEVVRNTEDLAYELDVPGVGTIKPKNLRLQTVLSMPHENGAPHFEKLVPKLLEWLNRLVDAGEIRAPRPAGP